jgi:hypothetical protein
MQVRELKLRDGQTITPLVHKDAVVDSSRDPLKNWIAPISVDDISKGKSSYTNFKGSQHIDLTGEVITDASGVNHVDLTFTHDNTTTVTSPSNTIYLTGVENTGNQPVKMSQASFNPSTNVLAVSKTDTNLVGGSTGSIVYQSATDATTMLPIGTQDQILMVKSGIPTWVKKTAGVTDADWLPGTTEGPILELIRDNEPPVDSEPIPSASASASGIITTTTQTFAGVKTFADDVNIANTKVIKFNNVQVLSATQYTGNSATADKTNHELTFSNDHVFDGSADVTVGQNDIDGVLNVSHGGTGNNTLTLDTLYLGNGTNAIKPLTNGVQYNTISINSSGIPAYGMLTLNHIPEVPLTLYADSSVPDVADFAI